MFDRTPKYPNQQLDVAGKRHALRGGCLCLFQSFGKSSSPPATNGPQVHLQSRSRIVLNAGKKAVTPYRRFGQIRPPDLAETWRKKTVCSVLVRHLRCVIVLENPPIASSTISQNSLQNLCDTILLAVVHGTNRRKSKSKMRQRIQHFDYAI